MVDFVPFPKVPRLHRECVITEKIDGTNASVWVEEVSSPTNPFSMDQDCFMVPRESGGFYAIAAGSRKRFVTPGKATDNFGFAGWVRDNAEELVKLGPGIHYGEWWGEGIQRGYGLDEKRFSLFNAGRWFSMDNQPNGGWWPDNMAPAPACCGVIPVLWNGPFQTQTADIVLMDLARAGSVAAPGYMNPEGIMIYHTAARQYFKKTFEDDDTGKG